MAKRDTRMASELLKIARGLISVKHADYVYRNQDDTIRFRIFRRQGQEYRDGKNEGWDADIFMKSGAVKTYCVDAACSNFRTKADMKRELEREYGSLRLMNNVDNILEGWG